MNKTIMHTRLRIIVLIFIVPQCVSLSGECPNLRTDIRSIRKRRYLYFPDGSDAVVSINAAKTFMTHVPSGWFVTMDLDVIFPLPEKEFIAAQFRRKLHHRQKRQIWERVKNALNLRNMNGHACVLRSICEAKMHLAPPGKSLVHDLLRAIFTAPLQEREFAEEMGEEVFKEISDPRFCEQPPDCPFSLLQFILGFNKKRK